MGTGTSPELVSAVSNAGGLGALGCHGLRPEQVDERTASIRRQTNKPFGRDFLLFDVREDSFAAALELRPAVMQFAWARPEQDLRAYFERSHQAGCLVTYMAGNVPEAIRAVKAGADVIIAQGTEGGGHVGWMASMPLTPMVVDCRRAHSGAGGRWICRRTRPRRRAGARRRRHPAGNALPRHRRVALHQNFRQAIVDSDGHDTQLSEIPDIASGLVWPGAMIRSRRNRFIQRWAGREWALRRDQAAALEGLNSARKSGDIEEGSLATGQDTGLIRDIPPAGEVVTRIAEEAEEILRKKLPALVAGN
jgi:NAD(P)H-dependent flavin oxidoreductase YrpB (nitropropane dioxygenase family)